MGVTEEDLFCSWGDYDRAQFEQDCAYHGAPYPFGENHLNLRVAYSKAKASEYRFTVEEALHHIGLTLQGTYHRGIDDARNIARLLPHIVMP